MPGASALGFGRTCNGEALIGDKPHVYEFGKEVRLERVRENLAAARTTAA